MESLSENYNIKTVCQMTGITEFVLRAWEKRYHVVNPLRQPNGHRTYTTAEIEKLRKIKHLVDQGRAISKVARLPEEELNRLTPPSVPTFPSHLLPAGLLDQDPHPENLAGRLEAAFAALKRFDLDKINGHLSWGRTHLQNAVFMSEMVLPLVKRLRENVGRKVMSLSHQHAFTEMLNGHLLDL